MLKECDGLPVTRADYREEEESEKGFSKAFPLATLRRPIAGAAYILELKFDLVQGRQLLRAFQLRLFALEPRQVKRAVAITRACGGSRLGLKLLLGELAQ